MNKAFSGGHRDEAEPGRQRSSHRGVGTYRCESLVLLLFTGLVALQPAAAQTDKLSSSDVGRAVVIDTLAVDLSAVEPPAEIDEIVVTAERKKARAPYSESPFSDPLRERIRHELRQLNLLIDEYDWRLESVRFEKQPPRFRWGYEPREHLRVASVAPAVTLPLDLVQPATIFSAGF